MIVKKFIADLGHKVYYFYGDKKYGIIAMGYIHRIIINDDCIWYHLRNTKIVAIKVIKKEFKEKGIRINQFVVPCALSEKEFDKKWFIDKSKLKEVLRDG